MNVLKVTPRGFCLGVVKSIKLAKETVIKYPNHKIYMIGLLVHNKIIVNELESFGIKVIDDWKKSRYEIIKEIDKNSVVIFSAHGTDHKVIELAKSRNLICVDTKCEWVAITEKLILEHLKKDYKIIFIGKKYHPETIALTSLNENIYLITDLEEVNDLKIISNKIFITNQTTLSILDTNKIYDALIKKYPHAESKNDICEATLLRQQAVLNLDAASVDLLYVVGDERSNNTLKLVELGNNKGIKTLRINNKNDINKNDLKLVKKVAVTAGASTSSIIQNQVIKFLEQI